MDLWLTEWHSDNLKLQARIDKTVYTARSEYQEIAIVDSQPFGRMLVLDGVFQTSVFEEYIYHEMIVHVPLCVHPAPKRVLVIGGGDGGSVREVVRHDLVESVEMVEIDGMVVAACKEYLPETSAAIINNHPKLTLTIGDGIKHMQQAENVYDVIIVDCSDPIGPGEGLFSRSFYQDVYKALKPDGMFVQQTESPFFHQELIRRIYQDINSNFPITRLYLAQIPLYPGGTHSFTIGSKQIDPLTAPVRPLSFATRYYNSGLQTAAFVLPNYAKELIR